MLDAGCRHARKRKENTFYRMCSLTIECVLLGRRMQDAGCRHARKRKVLVAGVLHAQRRFERAVLLHCHGVVALELVSQCSPFLFYFYVYFLFFIFYVISIL